MSKKPNKIRLNIRIPKHLRIWLTKYADKKNTTVTQVIVDLMTACHAKDKP